MPVTLYISIVVLGKLASLSDNGRLALGQVAAKCKGAGMRINTSKTDVIVFSRKRVQSLSAHSEFGDQFLTSSRG